MADTADSAITYLLIHACVDGAGVHGTYTDLAKAIAEANRLQAASDARGNPWSYPRNRQRAPGFSPGGEWRAPSGSGTIYL